MPAVPLITGPTVTQNSPLLSITMAVTIASTHCAYPWKDDQAESAWVAIQFKYQDGTPANGHLSQY